MKKKRHDRAKNFKDEAFDTMNNARLNDWKQKLACGEREKLWKMRSCKRREFETTRAGAMLPSSRGSFVGYYNLFLFIVLASFKKF